MPRAFIVAQKGECRSSNTVSCNRVIYCKKFKRCLWHWHGALKKNKCPSVFTDTQTTVKGFHNTVAIYSVNTRSQGSEKNSGDAKLIALKVFVSE